MQESGDDNKSSEPQSSARGSQHSLHHHSIEDDDDDEKDALRNMIFNSQASTQSVAYAPSSANKSSKSPSRMLMPKIVVSQVSKKDTRKDIDRDLGGIDFHSMIFNENGNDSDSSESYHADVSKITRMTKDKFKKRKRPDFQVLRNSHKTIVCTMKQRKTHLHPIFHNSYDLRSHSLNY